MPSNEVLKRFDFGVNVTKAWINKETGKHYVKAIASDTGVDHHGERFSEKAIDGMVDCIVKSDPAPVILLPTHWDTFEIGKAVEAKAITSPTHPELKALDVTIELDMEYPQAKSLYKEVESGNAQKQLSVGGYLNPDSEEPYFWEEKQYETEDGNVLYDYLLVLNDLKLDHIAVTRKDHAANPRTSFSEAVAKSWGLEKPVRPEIKKEVKQMSKAEKQAESLVDMIGKSIKDFFKSNDADNLKVQAAREAVEKAKEALAEVKGLEGAEGLEAELGFVKSEEVVEPAAEETQVEEVPAGEAEKTSEEAPAEEAPVAEEAEKTSEEAPQVDVEALKSSIVEDITKSLSDSQQETFKEISKSLGDVIAETIKSQVAPLQQKIAELEKFSGKSKSLNGQEDLEESVVKSVSNQDDDGDLWSGFIKAAIPSHVLAEKKFEGGNE